MSGYSALVSVAALCVLAAAIVIFFATRKRTFLDPTVFKAAALTEKETVTHNTKRFRFALPGGCRLGLPVGQHISFKFTDGDGRDVMRSYTPVTGNETRGHVDFVIKIYALGRMSQHLDNLQVGDVVLMRGPKGRLTYVPNMKRAIGMIAGGSGITPMYQIAKDIVSNPRDTTQVSIVFANVSINDILIKGELDELATQHPQQIHLHYVLDSAPLGWLGSTGHVTADVIQAHCPPPGPENMLFFCGPRPMTEAMKRIASEMGYEPQTWHEF